MVQHVHAPTALAAEWSAGQENRTHTPPHCMTDTRCQHLCPNRTLLWPYEHHLALHDDTSSVYPLLLHYNTYRHEEEQCDLRRFNFIHGRHFLQIKSSLSRKEDNKEGNALNRRNPPTAPANAPIADLENIVLMTLSHFSSRWSSGLA
jgi:hypothetical protein